MSSLYFSEAPDYGAFTRGVQIYFLVTRNRLCG